MNGGNVSGLEFGPVAVTGAAEFVEWSLGMISEIRALVSSGEVAPIPSFDDVLGVFDKVLGELDQRIRAARASGSPTIPKSIVAMTVPEFRTLKDVGRAIESYVGILATRGLVNMDLSPDVAECMDALLGSAYVTAA